MMNRNPSNGPLRAIGIRASPKTVYYAIVEPRDERLAELLVCSEVLVPPALEPPAQLNFVRTTLLDIMDEYDVRRAGIRVAEYNARQISWFRRNLEGVIQELLAASSVGRYFAGPIATIASRLGEDRKQIKSYLDGEPFPGMEDWSQSKLEERESVLTAMAALMLGRHAHER